MKLFVSCFLLLLCLALSASAISVEEMAAQPSVLDLVTPVAATASNSAAGATFAEESELHLRGIRPDLVKMIELGVRTA
jgi:hypothetical protein